MRLQGTKSLSKRPTFTGPKGLEPITILFLQNSPIWRTSFPNQTTVFLSCVPTIVTQYETCIYDHSHETNRLIGKSQSHGASLSKIVDTHTPESIHGPAHKVACKLCKRNKQKIHTVFLTLHSI
jgi:hypothetical protein